MEKKYEVFRTSDNTVSKYIHADGSETAIKLVKSIQSVLNPLTNTIETHESERNKFSIFISSSVGCFMSCKFCHLTLKGAKHQKIEEQQVLNNIKEAIEDIVLFNPDIKNRYVKLSWMGMGDAMNKPEMVSNVSTQLLDWLFENNYAVGLDGVDLSTVMPKMKDTNWIDIYHTFEEKLQKYRINPIYTMDNVEFTNNKYTHQNIFRIFYSIGSAIQEQKDIVIPNAMPLVSAINVLKEYEQEGKYPVILHHVLVDGMNDSEDELNALISLVNDNFKDNELRILRYNSCLDGTHKESSHITEQIKKLSDNVNFLKVQVSAGSQVKAACGEFIVKDFVRLKRQTI